MQSVQTSEDSLRPHCYACGSSRLHRKFPVPLLDGPYQREKDTKFRTFYRCDWCGQLSADLHDADKFADYYASLSDDYHCDHDREQFRYARILELFPMPSVKRVLDIGCGSGTFLGMLPPEIDRFGIEPSRTAAELAREKGIKTVRYDDLARPELRNTFDLVTAIDVVEHAANLQEFRGYLTTALRPGGMAIILTGNAGSWPARLLGRYWYYLNYAEHITVFCPRSMRTWLEKDFSEIELSKAKHHRLSLRETLALTRAWIIFPAKLLLRRLSPAHSKIYAALYLPGDHMLVRAIHNRPLQPGTTKNVD